jgi:hypothetical protein
MIAGLDSEDLMPRSLRVAGRCTWDVQKDKISPASKQTLNIVQY